MDWTNISNEQRKQFQVSKKSMTFRTTAFINDYEVELTIVATLDCVLFVYERYEAEFDIFVEFMKSCDSVIDAKQLAEEVYKLHMTSNEFRRLGFEDIS